MLTLSYAKLVCLLLILVLAWRSVFALIGLFVSIVFTSLINIFLIPLHNSVLLPVWDLSLSFVSNT